MLKLFETSRFYTQRACGDYKGIISVSSTYGDALADSFSSGGKAYQMFENYVESYYATAYHILVGGKSI